MADGSPRLGGIELEHPLLNAAGTCRTVEDAAVFARSACAAVVVGSITLEPRAGNPGTVFHSARPRGAGAGPFALNALGLPNRGAAFYREHLPEMTEIVHQAGKPIVLSVAGFDTDEYAELAAVGARGGADLVELNLGCPNVWDGGRQKRVVCFDPVRSAAICRRVAAALSATVPAGAVPAGAVPAGTVPPGGSAPPRFGVKISPFSDPAALAELAEALAALAGTAAAPAYVASANTFPNALAFDERGRSVTDVELAGLSGPALRPIALGQVRQLRALLPATIDVVGAGGISTGADLLDHLRAGASAAQAATAFWSRGGDAGVFGEILAGYAELAGAE